MVEGQEADLVLCGFRSSTGIDFTPEPQYLIGDDLSKNIQAIVENDYLLYSPWCKLFRRDIIQKHQHRFDPEIRLGEDTIFCYKYLLYCSSIKVVASNSYFYDGVWGGYKKYVLTRQEVEYLDKAEITTLHDINQHFNCRIDLTYRGYHVAMLKGLYEKFRGNLPPDALLSLDPTLWQNTPSGAFIAASLALHSEAVRSVTAFIKSGD